MWLENIVNCFYIHITTVFISVHMVKIAIQE